MKSKIYRPALVAAVALALGGCMVGPDYQRPSITAPAQYKELPGWVRAAPASAAPKGDWWKAFKDPLLDELAPQVAISNQTVAQSYANYQAALASIDSARSALFPTLGLGGNIGRQRGTPSAGGNGGAVRSSGSLTGTASWTPDFWGKVRRGVEESRASAQASEAELANALLSAQTELATALVELRITDANIDLLKKTVAAYQQFLQVVSNQDAAGTIPPSNLVSARAQLEKAQANLIALGVARAQYVHAIAVLVGKNPEDLDIAHSTALPALPIIPAGVPSTLLQRRPDIATAERQMAAQNAAIGVAEAAYYPDISLSALDGFAQSPLAGLFHAANHVWSLGANLGLTLFDGGARSANVAVAKAKYDAAVANYRGTVLSAFRNVEDDLSGLRILEQQAQVLDAAVRDSIRGTEIAQNEYQAGTVDFTTVATAQATQLANQQSALGVQQQRLLATVALIGDLGGGWSAEELTLARAQPGAQPETTGADTAPAQP